MERKPEFSAIETVYRGFEFRSRLEAKWAVFFDLCGWKWSYEPHDLNGWIPDFALGETFTLVEVKPFFEADQWTEAIQKICKSGYRGNVICLGADPTVLDDDGGVGVVQLGWLFDQFDYEFGDHSVLWKLHFGWTEGNGKLGLCPLHGGWVNNIWKVPSDVTDHPNKWSRVWPDDYRNDVKTQLCELWAQAVNLTKWFPKDSERVVAQARRRKLP